MPDEHNPQILQHDTGQNILHTNQVDTTEFLQNPGTPLFNKISNPSQTATIQNESKLSGETTNIPQSITITDGSSIVQIPVHNITQILVNDQTSNETTHNTNKDNTSTLSTSKTLTRTSTITNYTTIL